ncbi:hypothetical protein COK01_24215 [Priestia megaterium]|jgi:hypothetical protein|uniref:hypothetical protein n=1 Tax=Priestia megaterium TaxID=1404 RepID=UPI000BF93C39|nr:hypothetical protein [Priestia megaterium]RFB20948.1 hypothetical protein DZB87_26185 [Bacillus sp. ALD]MCR8866012.1 hypothetical protein [Priestia megaterium]MDR7207430.1 hypothetical protein [Priestia megaterium]PFK60645.1 hypothetical protein COJ21_31340 [Priestia megaterium]PFP45497.1 hypothetical protein COK01_24215 [Priestia megaterium]
MDELKKKIINKTDLHFFRYCEDTFGINRGVYNTIEQWFYKKDIFYVTERRLYIIDFLKYIFGPNKGYGKFGKGNLISKLHEFWIEKDKLNNS